jgi:hypothetical protein
LQGWLKTEFGVELRILDPCIQEHFEEYDQIEQTIEKKGKR